MLWSLAADILWILALSIMASLSRAAYQRTRPDARVPLVGLRVGRVLGYWTLPAIAVLAGLWLLWVHRTRAAQGDALLLTFGVRALAAALFPLLHLRLVGRALDVLGREDALKP